MCEVTNKNFDDLYNEIIDKIQSASFLSIDCEFSGLFDGDKIKCNLFDTPRARFNKLQNSMADFIIVQFGLSTFKYERSSNTFSVSTYNFYLKPATGLGNQKFSFQAGSVEFLCKNKFNFNKLFYDGIYYLNKCSEAEALTKIEEGLISRDNSEEIQKYCSEVSLWVKDASEGSEMLLELSDETSTFICLLHQEVRKRFHNVWTYFEDCKVVKIRKIKTAEKRLLTSSNEETLHLKKKLFKSFLGFSNIMKEIEKLKKPIVGHNILLDLILIYKQFYNPLPVSYKEFKRAIFDIFPSVFDTKNISFALRELLSKEKTWNSNNLSDLYYYLKHGKGATLVIFSPAIKHKNEEFIQERHFHDAGFDSYCTGFCFLKMAHIFSLKEEGRSTFQLTSLQTSSAWLLGAVAPLKNRVNFSRGQVDHIVLDGADPKSSRPGLLYIESKTNRPLNVSQVSEILAKYALVDIQPLSKYNGLMAVPNRKQAKKILERFKNDKDVKIMKYHFLRHSDMGRTIVSVTLVASLIFIAVFVSRFSKR